MKSSLKRFNQFYYATENLIKNEVEITDEINWGDKGISNKALFDIALGSFHRRQHYVKNALKSYKDSSIFKGGGYDRADPLVSENSSEASDQKKSSHTSTEDEEKEILEFMTDNKKMFAEDI